MKKIVIANFYNIWPANGGGQRRIFFLARELSKEFDVEIVVPAWEAMTNTVQFTSSFRLIRVAVEQRFTALARDLGKEAGMTADLAYTKYWSECQTYQDVLTKAVRRADVVVTAHPYSIYAILNARNRPDMPIVFDSQNVEVRQKASVLQEFPHYLEEIRRIERTALEASDRTLACSSLDAAGFAEEYGVDAARITIIENGVDAIGVPFVPPEKTSEMRSSLGISSRLMAVFGGSFHAPNIHAAESIIALAKKIPQMVFVFLGGVCNHSVLKSQRLKNVICLGEVDESTKWLVFNIADIGLNPMELGSGTNIKMFEYAAAGLAVLSTPFGARGIPLQPGQDFIVAEIGEMEAELGRLTVGDRERLEAMGQLARQKVKDVADWSTIGRRYSECFQSLAH